MYLNAPSVYFPCIQYEPDNFGSTYHKKKKKKNNNNYTFKLTDRDVRGENDKHYNGSLHNTTLPLAWLLLLFQESLLFP